jgi:hypothetical protein
MGIQLNEHERHAVTQLVTGKRLHIEPHAYFLGYLSSAVEAFLQGHCDKQRLADAYAFVTLLKIMYQRYDEHELAAIASGATELPDRSVLDGR